jgi:hypothetical protein
MTHSITTVSIMGLFAALSKKVFSAVTLSAVSHFFIVILMAFMLSVVKLNAVMLSVVAPCQASLC